MPDSRDPAPAATDAAVRRVGAVRIEMASGTSMPAWLDIPVEVPVNLVYGPAPFGLPYAVMMASPADLEDFAVGFSLTEGVVDRASEVRGVELEETVDGMIARVLITPDRMKRHLARRRRLQGRTSCGVCGVAEFDDLPRARPPTGPEPHVTAERLAVMLAALDHQQPLFQRTHAVHAALWFDAAGRLVATREDVGRHNALDKLIGALARTGCPPHGGAVLLTSRCSFEMVEKAAVFGARLVVAVSGPTSHAIERAQALGITLVAVARQDSALLFTRPTPARKAPARLECAS